MQTLALHPFFKDAGIEFERFDRRCHWKRYKAGEIFEDNSADVYFILSGEVRVLLRTARR